MIHKTKEEIVIILALLFYFVIHIWVAAEVHIQRNIPWEPDDHYHYVIKAGNLINTRIGSTPGLEDIYEQTELSNQSDELKKRKIRERHHFLQSYHPLYTIILVTIKYLGFSYEDGLIALEIIGAIIIGIGISFFSVIIFGKGPSAILLLVFSVLYLRGWGLHYTSPFTLASGCALISWGFLASNSKHSLIYSFILLTTASAFHPTGIILTALILLSAVLLYWRQFEMKLGVFLLLSSVAALFFYKFHFQFVDHDIELLGTYKHDDILTAITNNVNGFFSSIKKNFSDIVPYGYKWIFLFFSLSIILSRRLRLYLIKHIHNWYYTFPKNELYVIKIYGISLAILFLISLFSLVSLKVFDRIYLIYYTFFFGLICSITLTIFYDLYPSSWKTVMYSIKYNNWRDIGSYKDSLKFFSLVGLLFLFIVFMIFDFRRVYYGAVGKLISHNMNFNREQVSKLLSISNNKDRVLYNMTTNSNGLVNGVENFVYNNDENILNTDAEAASYFYFSYGASKRGAVLSNLINQKNKDIWINDNVRYMVTLSPPTVLFSGDLFISDNDSLYISSKGNSELIKTISFYIENKNPRHTVLLILNTSIKDHEIIIPSGTEGWYTFHLDYSELEKHKLSLSISSTPLLSSYNIFNHLKSFWRLKYLNRRIRIGGIRINSQETYWPWDSQYKIDIYKSTWGKKRKIYELPFNTSILSPIDNLYVDRIIDDKGSILLTSLKRAGN